MLTDHIAQFVPSPLIGENPEEFGVRFPDMSQIYDLQLQQIVRKAAAKLDIEIKEGKNANLTVFDLQGEYEIDPEKFISKGRATPFKDAKVFGKCLMTMCDGNIVWKDNE